MAWWIFQNLVTTAALAALVWTICRFTRIGPVARHALWVLVLVKFITPPLVVWPWAAPDPLGVARLDVRETPTSVTPLPGAFIDRESIGVSDALETALPSVSEPAPDSAPRPAEISTATWLLGLWIGGSIGLLAIEGARLIKLARSVRTALPADPEIERRVATLANQLGIAPVPVLTVPGSTSPVVACFGRPKLLWPADLTLDETTTQACIDGLIVHELAHVKRRDHLVGWIELVAGLVWWWNPLFWSVRSALREQAELACDAWVISALPNGRRAYAESLLALSSLGAAPKASIAAVVGVRASSRRVLERRLVMIMKGRASLRLPWAGLLTLVVLAAATLPAWATGTNDDTQQPTPVVTVTRGAQAKPTPQPKPQPATKTSQSVDEKRATVHVAKPSTMHTVSVTKHPETGKNVITLTPKHSERQVTVKEPNGAHFLFSLNQDKALTFFNQAQLAHLTEEGKQLVTGFDTEIQAIQKAATEKIKTEREAVIAKLQKLQDDYTKAGKLDEALAIRNYLRAGGPGSSTYFWTNGRGR